MGCVPHLGNARETLVSSRVLRCAGGMGSGLSMGARREITKKYAREYASASKKVRGRLLDELVATTGWSRANARRQVAAAMIDRLVHHAEVLSLAGDSYRTRARRALLQQQATNNTTENNNQQGGQFSDDDKGSPGFPSNRRRAWCGFARADSPVHGRGWADDLGSAVGREGLHGVVRWQSHRGSARAPGLPTWCGSLCRVTVSFSAV